MSRLVIAVLILFAVLVGLRAANSSLFQRNAIGQSNSLAPATRNTGFSTESTGSTAGTARLDAPGRANGITPLPPRNQPAIQGGW